MNGPTANVCRSCEATLDVCNHFEWCPVREVNALQREVEELRKQLRYANERNHERNVQLDALHFVWCDGGCYLGVHRFGDCDRPLTEQTVIEAERNTARLRRWWNASQHRVKHDVPGAHSKAIQGNSTSPGGPNSGSPQDVGR